MNPCIGKFLLDRLLMDSQYSEPMLWFGLFWSSYFLCLNKRKNGSVRRFYYAFAWLLFFVCMNMRGVEHEAYLAKYKIRNKNLQYQSCNIWTGKSEGTSKTSNK